ncbi:Heat shock transcription factor [Malassezia brasiliensis]|uniref:Heat shock transcription factor n=1 Tax=Malassezia brasiliensis TaxID=1821822 RepID=A0AAF0ING5_9BASI|nr:Heat shock transcription factor [Malassezia brasiliensis]
MAQRPAWSIGSTSVAQSINTLPHAPSQPHAESSSTPLQPFRPEMVSSGAQRPEADHAAPTVMSRSNPAFLNKLRSMVDDPNTDEFIRWSPAGDTFLVPNHVRFGDEVLPRFFKHNNFSSFVRQLNMYGFHKVPHLQQGALKHDQPSQNELWEFSNPCFHRDQPELLSKVQRKRSGKEREHANQAHHDDARQVGTTSNALTRGEFSHALGDADAHGAAITTAQLNSLMSAIQGIKNNQRTIIEEISQLQHSSHALWQQGIENRQQTRKQQDTINRILRFMASVFGSSNVGDILHNQSADGGANSTVSKDTGFNDIGTPPRTYGPPRPQKRQRLLIGDTSHADQFLNNSEFGMLKDANDYNAMSDADRLEKKDSPANSWTRITEKLSPDSVRDASSRSSQNTPNTEGWQPQTPLQSSEALMNAMGAGGDNNAWINSLLASQSPENNARVDPQLLAALQNALASQSGMEDTMSGPGAQTANLPMASWHTGDAPPNSNQWSAGPIQNALIHTPRGSVTSLPESGGGVFPLPEQQFAQDVQRVNRNVQSNVDQTTKLQNSINALVQSLRLDPTASAGKTAQPVGAGVPPLNNMTSPSSYVSASGTTSAPTPNGNAAGDFDLDSFLNQFVDPVNGPAPSPTANSGTNRAALADNAPVSMPEDAVRSDTAVKGESTK